MTIDHLCELCDDADFWRKTDLARITSSFKKQKIRQLIRQLKDDDGFPVLASIVVEDNKGKKQRVYMQETLFDLEQYKQVITYHKVMGYNHMFLANGYAQRCKERLGKQMPLPFPNLSE